MDENLLGLEGLDPAARELAAEEAARRGLSLSEYLTDILREMAEDVETAEFPEVSSTRSDSPEDAESLQAPFAVRHRLDLIERRVGSTVGGLSAEVRALDGAVGALAIRIDDASALSEDTAETVNVALQEIRASVAAVRKRVGDAELEADALEQSNDAAHRNFEQRICAAESLAQHAYTAVDAQENAHHALKHALAEDFRDLATDTAQRVAEGLDSARAAADAAADRTDAAVTHLLRELRVSREAIDAQIAESAEQARQRLQTAVRELGGRLDTVALRVAESAQTSERALEDLVARLSESENFAQVQLRAVLDSVEQSGAALRGEVGELRDAHLANQGRMKLTDEVVGNMIGEIAAISEAVDRRLAKVQSRGDQAFADLQGRVASLDARATQTSQEIAQAKRVLSADLERVESCTLASLQKLGADIVAAREAAQKIVADAKGRLEADLAALRNQDADLLARVKALDSSIATIRDQSMPLDERLTRLESERESIGAINERLARVESASSRAETEKGVAALRRTITALAMRIEAQDIAVEAVPDLAARLAAQEGDTTNTANRVDALASVLGRFTSQSTEAAAQADERLQRLEASVLGLQSDEDDGAETHAQIAALEKRLFDMEERRADSLEALRGQIASFIAENDRRLMILETVTETSILNDAPVGKLADDFESLRASVEERLLGVEARSVRALEQVSESIALIERRAHFESDLAQSA